MHDRLVRAGPFAVAPLGHGFHVASHVLGHGRLLCDARVLEILEWHARPRRPVDVAAHFGEEERGVSFVLGHLVQAQLLVAAGLDSRRRIRDAFASRREGLPAIAPSVPLEHDTLERWNAADESLSEAEAAAFALAPRARLVLSPHVVSMAVAGGETIALHPLGPRVHLRDGLWRLVRAFRVPMTIAAAAEHLGRSTDEVVEACRFLILKRLLWPGRASERRALRALGERFSIRADGPSVRQWTEPHHQWTDVATPYDWEDVRRTRAFGRVAVVGQCQINFAGAALQRLARRHGVHLELFGEAVPSEALAKTSWAAVFLSLADGAAELHEAVARAEWTAAQHLLPGLVAHADELALAARRYTRAPLAVLSVAPPGLSTSSEEATGFHTRGRLYAELNERLASALRGRGVFVLDESRLVASQRERVILDDEYTGSAHHCAYNPRFWIELTQWSEALAPKTYPMGDPQAGASDVLAAGFFDFLRRRHERSPVRIVIFNPDTLLWPGRLADKPSAHDSLQRALGRPDYQRYCGINEALLAIRARGVKLVCLSPLPQEELRAKWNVPGTSRAFVSADHLAAIARTPSELEHALTSLGVRTTECLCLGLDRAPSPAGARVFRGDPWAIKRYLLTAPELASNEPPTVLPAESAPDMDQAGANVPDEEVERTLDAAIEHHLRLPAGGARGSDDLRLLGLDSLTALELARDVEAKLGIVFPDRDLTVATLYHRSTLLGAALRARGRGTALRRAPSMSRASAALETLFAGESVVDILAHHAEAARHPWQVKMLRSTAPNDYEYAGWGTLLERAGAYADSFTALGAAAGDVVTLMLPQGVALVAAYLGALLHGFVPSIAPAPSVKLSESAFSAWFGEVAARSRTSLILCDEAHVGLVRACIAASAAPHIRVSSAAPSRVTPGALSIGRRRGGPLLLQHSSGTTGLKKAVLLDERAVLAQVRHLARELACDGRDVVVSWAPLYHDMGLIACLLLPLLADLPVVMMSPFDWLASPELLLREVSRERGTLSWMPNFGFQYCAQRIPEESIEGLDLSSWRAVVNCSEPVTARAAEAFYRRFARAGLRRSALSASFAMAETTFAVTQVPPGRGLVCTPVDAEVWRTQGLARPDPRGSVVLTGSGAPIGGTTIEIVDAEGKPLENGRAGEIRVKSESRMHGYAGDPEGTASAIRGGWYYTGDVGVLLEGELYVTGRKRDLIIIAGHNVHPHDVEESVGALPEIRPGRVVALAVEDEALGTQRLVVLAETRVPLDERAAAALAARVRAVVASVFGVNAHDVRFFGEATLLKSTSGKLSRARNRELYLSEGGTRRSA